MDTKVNKISFSHRCYQWWKDGKNRGMFYHSATATATHCMHFSLCCIKWIVCTDTDICFALTPHRWLHLVPRHGWSYDVVPDTTGGDWSGVSKLGAEYTLQAITSPASTLLILPPACWLLCWESLWLVSALFLADRRDRWTVLCLAICIFLSNC